MSAIPQPASSRLISERILEPLRQVARRQWTVLATKGVIQTLLFSLGLILAAVLVLGRFSNIPVWVRIPVAIIVWGSVIGSAIRFLRPALQRRSLVRTALDVERQLKPRRNTQERISSSVELTAEKDARFAGSPALVAHLVKQAESDAAAVDPKAIVPTDKVVRLGIMLIPLLLLWVGMVWFMPREKMLLPMYHLLMPWKTAPAVLSHVVVDPGDKTLAQGDNLEIRVHVNADGAADRDRKIEHASITMSEATGKPAVQELARTGPRDFRIPLENLQKGFHYRIGTDEGDSPDYTIIVNPRPSVEQLDLRYDYPAYTGLEMKLDANSETGNIDAIQNTKVTVIVHCSNLLTSDSKLVVTDRVTNGKAEPREYPLTRGADGNWQAQIVVINSAQYVIKLTNNYGLTNKDDQPHLITARFDEKPTITITAPQTGITVRPDDVVPVEFLATDDFGVAKVDAFVQVDGAPQPQSIAVKLHAGDRHTVVDKYMLDIPRALAGAKLPDAQGLTYWLVATDNRDPDPQSTESTHQTLRLDRNAKGIAEQQDEKRAHDLMEAIRKAIYDIDQERPQAETFVRRGKEAGSLSNDERLEAESLKDHVEKTSADLVAAADEHKEDAFAAIAAKAREISEKLIAGAAEDVSKVELHSDAFEPRSSDAKDAVAKLDDAKKQLEALLKQAEKQQQNVQTADKLQELAKDQKKLAEKAANAQPNQPQDQSQQQQVAQQTQQAVSQDRDLNNEKAQREAQELAKLLNKVAEIEKNQEKQEEQVQKQAAAAEVQQQADSLAKKQEELNKKIEDFKQADKSAIEKANAQPPQQQQQQNIVKELNQNQVQQAANDQKNAAQQLEAAANQLQQKANDNNLQPNADQQNALNQQQQQAQQAQQQAQQAQQETQQAQQAQQAVQQAQQQAQQAQNANNADQKKNAAQQAAQAAQQAAQVAKQVEQQAKATEKQAAAAAQDAHADVQQAAKQAEQAAEAAEKAAQAAEQAADQAQAAAQQGDAQAAAQDAQQAGQDAAQAAQQEQAAAQALAQADKQEGEHAKGEMLAQQKEQAAEAAAEAHELAKEQAALAEAAQAPAQALQQAQQGAEPAQQAAAEEKHLAAETKQAEAAAAQLEKQADAQGNQELAKRADAAKADLKEAQAAQEEAAHAEAAGQPDQAAGQQEKAENALAQAEQALRGEAAQADAGKPDAGQPDAGKPDAGAPDAGKPDAGQGQAEAGEPHPGEAGQAQAAAQQAATPEQALAQAAQHAQEAVQAQQQAEQGNAAASQEAAQALAQAAQELAQATNPSGQPGQEQGQEPGQDPGQADAQKQPSPMPGQATDPQMGLQAQANAASDGRPESVQQLGISASDWARLGPLQQKELVNAAQQSGPPTYQAMIKNYYVRLAHMQAQAGSVR